mmetsp:Transcript_13192/g.18271  ORF Transcript_13192/g.18271 Transcript_13192/m.18271 type:complete len:315 (+) Transcript_13192:151-1095(+)|eukprot:CAMPEP_0184487266 /NCGR_PEP_ID=MMETSP0113_2-20130426/9629_1 /TAXON_ID=91329 /ORGANISM="Norrisiella sphaerica, Strain BC52" /LENGTH=314 /DNA_ID=CAMNT_0026869499 /DNA_START=151 /DNA_END=1095 /DNA_ORIENTATION=-
MSLSPLIAKSTTSRRGRCLTASAKPVSVMVAVATTGCLMYSSLASTPGLSVPMASKPISLVSRGPRSISKACGQFQDRAVLTHSNIFETFEKGFGDFMFGWKDDKWNPDRRSEEEKGVRFRKSASSLSWGTRDWTEEAQDHLRDFLKGRDYPMRVATDVLDESSAFDSSTDVELNQQLVSRMKTRGENRYVSGRKLAELIYAKYGKYHDLTVLQAKPFGPAFRQVAVNIYGPHLGNPSFPYSENQYLQKLDDIAHMLNTWDQAWYVQEFLESAIKPRRGLPSRPRSDTAVTLRLNQSPTWPLVPDDQVAEAFSW